ncbi:solute carrier family 13 member 2-like [Hypomesus transpacificus]|uniref:solute carrier family 13 member 2-like n=1 Tax=Hypomesus transpacificus TaxID=137520 RepID=UPI001F071EC0|nr:solute carrier family 13 member 2-like [Hypomesus transpacificus]
MAGFLRWFWMYRNYLIILLSPLVILPLPLVSPGMESRCGYVIILMALFWCTECIPLAITALLPVILFPMMGIMESSEVCNQYMKDSTVLGIGGLMVAIAVEHTNLHKRIAFRVLLGLGVKPPLLMMGFMVTTAFLSMWISNTASTAMMLPITSAVLQQLSDTEAQAEEREMDLVTSKAGPEGLENQAFELDNTTEDLASKKFQPKDSSIDMGRNNFTIIYIIQSLAEQRRLEREQKYLSLSKGLSLSVCYASSIGGTATLTGATTNIIFKGQVDELFPDNGDIINFTSWFGFAFPNMVLMLMMSWLWLKSLYLGINIKSFGCGTNKDCDKEAMKLVKDESKKLGSMSFAEVSVLVLFVLLVLLWVTREPGFMPGWGSALFNKDRTFVTDATVSVFISVLFFIIPSQMPRCWDFSVGSSLRAPSTLITWDIVQKKMPWNLILLLGGGFALAKGSETSGLSRFLGQSLVPLQALPPFAIPLVVSLLMAIFTECTSNVAATSLILPVLASMATALKLHPLYVMLPCTICASLAFMLPVATPPNAIAFSYSNLKIKDMAKAGFVLNIVGVLTANIALNTWGTAMFDLNTFPDWANATTTP